MVAPCGLLFDMEEDETGQEFIVQVRQVHKYVTILLYLDSALVHN